MTTCICPNCGSSALQIDRYQETATYHCGQCGTLATQANSQPIRVRCIPKLVGLCREFQASDEYDLSPENVGDKWENLGIRQLITPEDRPCA